MTETWTRFYGQARGVTRQTADRTARVYTTAKGFDAWIYAPDGQTVLARSGNLPTEAEAVQWADAELNGGQA